MLEIHGKQQVATTKEMPWENDTLRREAFGKVLIESLGQLQSPSTIALIGKWGAGKTTFLRMLGAEYQRRGNSPVIIHFDAWGRDFSDDPFASFCAAIHVELAKHQKAALVEKKNDLLKKARKVIGAGIASSIKAGGAMAGGLLSALGGHDPITGTVAGGAVGAIGETLIEKAIDTAADKVQEVAAKAPEARTEFRAALGKVVAALSTEQSADANACKLLIFVDELDRCRPDFAIRLLETIKHFFDVPGVTFLLAYDEGYLKSATQALYGTEFDGETYLRRFVDVRFWLPTVDRKEFLKKLVEHYRFSTAFPPSRFQETELLGDSLVNWADMLGLTLRDAEQAFASCRLMFSLLALKADVVIYPCIFLAIAKFANHKIVANVTHGTEPFSQIPEVFGDKMRAARDPGGIRWEWLEALFKHADMSDKDLRNFLTKASEGVSANAVSSAMNAFHSAPYGNRWREYLNQIR